MSRKTDSGSSRGLDDIIGVVLLVAAFLLLLAQLSFSAHDIGYLSNPPTRPAHNFIGPLGAYLAWWIFLLLGVIGYFLPFLIAVFGTAYLFGFLTYLRERVRSSLMWSFGLLVSLTGLLYLGDHLLGN
ncbi:MAG TPA: DNA translocase FtsK 4TM domain-containing protein, partial [Verrucomicrobiae bacterium]|nr:DNA translocase FtsK 4TM domain-containing protein [Verrucomicrobiae bacterium]